MDLLEECTIGSDLPVETCHKTIYDKEVGLIPVDKLDEVETKLVCYRTGIDEHKIKSICYHHKQTLLVKYELYQRRCCDPFKNHSKPIKGM